jgi:hypothetical protein
VIDEEIMIPSLEFCLFLALSREIIGPETVRTTTGEMMKDEVKIAEDTIPSSSSQRCLSFIVSVSEEICKMSESPITDSQMIK